MLFTLLLATLCLGCQVGQSPIYDEGDIIELIEEVTKPLAEHEHDHEHEFVEHKHEPEPMVEPPIVEPGPVSEAIANARSVTIEEIVADTAQGGTVYEGQTVKIRFTVDVKFDHSVSVATYRRDVGFIFVSPDAPERLQMMEWQKTYDVTISIYTINKLEGLSFAYSIWAEIETDPVFVDVPPEVVSVPEVVKDVASGSYAYVSKAIKVKATVEKDTSDRGHTGIINLQTRNSNVVWDLVEYPDEGTLIPLRRGETYTFTMYIYQIHLPNPDAGVNHYRIVGVLQAI